MGVYPILAVGSDLASSARAVTLAQRHDVVYAAVGIHPHEADKFENEADSVKALLTREKVVAVGEIGLDYHRLPTSRDEQMVAFEEQLRWAREGDLPVSVHNRAADEDVLTAVKRFGVRAVLHCFSGCWTFACQALGAGLFLSFAGNLTYPKAGEVRDVASRVPQDGMLVETDAPVLAPQPWRGRRNEPAHIVATLETLATIRRMPVDSVAEAVSRNAAGLFGWGLS